THRLVQREESASRRRRVSSRPACRSRTGVDANSPGHVADGGRARGNQRWRFLVQPGQRDRHPGGLYRGCLASMTRSLVNVPKTAKRGEIIEIRAMIQHVM